MKSDWFNFERELDKWGQAGSQACFWWRDDDAIEPTPALERMLSLANTHKVDLAFAVIPKMATKALAERFDDEPHALVLQHGWQHKNFQRKDLGEKAAELGSRRDPDDLMAELKAGHDRLWHRSAPDDV